MQSIYLPALDANFKAVEAGNPAPNLITKSFYDAFVNIGGAGATLALLIAIFIIVRKRAEYKEVAKLSLALGLFNINESVMYGLPVVLNPILLIPFMLIPGILSLVAYIFTVAGLVPATYVAIPWITPVGISGFMATGGKGIGSIMGGLLSIINLVIAVLIYLPFVRVAEKQAIEREKQKI